MLDSLRGSALPKVPLSAQERGACCTYVNFSKSWPAIGNQSQKEDLAHVWSPPGKRAILSNIKAPVVGGILSSGVDESAPKFRRELTSRGGLGPHELVRPCLKVSVLSICHADSG